MNLLVRTLLILVTVVRIRANLPIKSGLPLPNCDNLHQCDELYEHEQPGYKTKVCGSDGYTYSSYCQFMRVSCREGGVKFKSVGECSASEKCWGERHKALKSAKKTSGLYIPRCNPDGSFKAIQCHKHTQYCWCATPWGNIIRGTVTESRTLDCTNVTKQIETSTSASVREFTQNKGTDPGTQTLVISPGQVPPLHATTRDPILTILEVGEVPRQRNKKRKRPRGCHGSRRKSFNKKILKNIIKEYKRENRKLVNTFSETELQLVSLDWKFKELDVRPNDGRLRRREYKGIRKVVRRNIRPKKCAHKFPTFCDLDNDRKISREEWTECFTSSSDEESSIRVEKVFSGNGQGLLNSESPNRGKIVTNRRCEYDRKEGLENGSPNLYIPKCDANGNFRPIQCYGSNATNLWYCFCVDVKTGEMIEKTSTKDGTPNCSVSWPKCPRPEKETKFLNALRSHYVKYARDKISKNDRKGIPIDENSAIEQVFKYLDQNHNNFLEKKEKKLLRRTIPKKNKNLWICGRKIHIVCDANFDKKISLKEFMNCLTPRKSAPSLNDTSRIRFGLNPLVDTLTPLP